MDQEQKSRINHALIIGFLAGILIFGLIGWFQSENKNIGFFIPMLIPVYFIYKLLRKNGKWKGRLST